MSILDKLKNNKKKSPLDRRTKNNKYIKKMNIACYENLPCIESSEEVKLKDIDTICKRAIACVLSIQVACDIGEKRNTEASQKTVSKLLKDYKVENELLDIEKKLFNNTYKDKDIINITWTYECYWSLIWALGLIDDKEFKIPSDICNCNKAIKIVSDCKTYEEFKNKIRPRNIEEILDMLDLYYRYHWACVEKRLKPDTNIGPLNPEVVMERRRGLEWLISDIKNWNEISLDT